MKVPDFIKEVVWALYPPRYRQLANKSFRSSLWFMTKILLIAFFISGVLFLPKLVSLKGSVNSELEKFDVLKFTGDVSQTAPVSIPPRNPWVVVDLNGNHSLTKEFLVVDSETIQYRFFKIKSVPREQVKDASGNRAPASGFFASMILLMIPGIVLLLFVRMWLKYLLLVFVFGTFFFILFELTRYRLKWKQMLSVAAHSSTLVIFIEVISGAITTVFLIPVFRFLGVQIFAVTTLAFAALVAVGSIGYYLGKR